MLIVPSALRAGRRRRRWAAPPPDVALAAWHEVVDTAADLGLQLPSGATPTAAAALLRARLASRSETEEARAALDRLVAALQGERYGGVAAHDGTRADARLVVGGLRSASSARERLVARFAPRSLFATSPAKTGSTA